MWFCSFDVTPYTFNKGSVEKGVLCGIFCIAAHMHVPCVVKTWIKLEQSLRIALTNWFRNLLLAIKLCWTLIFHAKRLHNLQNPSLRPEKLDVIYRIYHTSRSLIINGNGDIFWRHIQWQRNIRTSNSHTSHL